MRADIGGENYLGNVYITGPSQGKCNVGCVRQKIVDGSVTYHDNTADDHQVPDQVLFPREFGIALFKLAQVCETEVCIEENSEIGLGDQEARYKSVNTRRKLEEEAPVEPEWVAG